MSHIQIRISDEEKKKAQAIFSSMGLNLSSALKLFIRKTIQEKKIPFEISGATYVPEVSEVDDRINRRGNLKETVKDEEVLSKEKIVAEKQSLGFSSFIRKKIGF